MAAELFRNQSECKMENRPLTTMSKRRKSAKKRGLRVMAFQTEGMIKPSDEGILHFNSPQLFTIPAIFARAKGLIRKKQCHMVSQGANKC